MPRRRRRTYGTGTVFRRADRGTWSIAWRADGRRHQAHAFPTEDAARKQLAVELGDAAAGKRKVARGGATLAELAAPWLKERAATHRSAYDDANRWKNHVEPEFGRLRPDQVTVVELKVFCASRKRAGLASATVQKLIRLLSTLYTDLIESGHATVNPCRMLSKATRAKYMKPAHDPKRTPFLEDEAHVVAVYQALEAKTPTVAMAFALGAIAGLRTGETRALRWDHLDLQRGVIHVQEQPMRRGGLQAASQTGSRFTNGKSLHKRTEKREPPGATQVLKDGDSRVVPIQPSLATLLLAWRERLTGGTNGSSVQRPTGPVPDRRGVFGAREHDPRLDSPASLDAERDPGGSHAGLRARGDGAHEDEDTGRGMAAPPRVRRGGVGASEALIGLVCPPLDGRAYAGALKGHHFLGEHQMSRDLRAVLAKLELARPGLGWYQATRHTFACHWVMNGGSMETLQRILGHSNMAVTERYAHLRPGHFGLADRNRMTVCFSKAVDIEAETLQPKETAHG